MVGASYGEGITYWPVVEILRGAAGIVDGDDAEVTVAKLAKLVEGEGDAELIAERLARTTGAVPGAAASDEIFWAVRKLFQAAARRRPLIVVIDDIHWAEPTLLDLPDHVVEWTRDAPILVLCIARPELLDGRPDWAGGKRNGTTIHLDPLSDEASTLLLGNLLTGATLPDDVRERITAAAEGIPLFVEEMVGMLVVRAPPSHRQRVASRRRPRRDGRSADHPGVAGGGSTVSPTMSGGSSRRRWWAGSSGAAPSRRSLRPTCSHARARCSPSYCARISCFLSTRPLAATNGFRFRHILIRDSAYDAIPKVARAAMHERFAAWLGDLFAGRTAEVEEILGYHLQEAHRNRVAIGSSDEVARALARRGATHLVAAGLRALGRNDYRGAVNLLERAHLLAEAPAAELLLAYGSALAHSGSLGRALGVIRSAVDAAERAGDERLAWYARIEEVSWRVQVETGAGVAAEILDLVPKAIPTFERLGDDVGAARAWMTIAGANSHLGHHARSLDAAESALAYAERAGDDSLVLGAYRLIGVAAIWGPMPLAEAERRYGHLLDRTEGGPLRKAAPMELVASLTTQLGDVAEGRELLARERAVRRARRPAATRESGAHRSPRAARRGRLRHGGGDSRRSVRAPRSDRRDELVLHRRSRAGGGAV